MTEAMFCEHANEVPVSCPCPPDCYCKTHSCKGSLQRTRQLRVAFCGASGTGKTTLSNFLVETLGIPFNPVGSRSVAKAMGFESPYDVDKAGKRAEFQRRLVTEKRTWEDSHAEFVSDRTTLDNLAYTVFHDISTVDAGLLEQIIGGMQRYTHVIFCPVNVFCNPAGDPSRVADMTYHQLYDTMIEALVQRHLPKAGVLYGRVTVAGHEARRAWLKDFLPF
jgi:AAA domain